jgi:hypothetical protein
MVGSATWRAFSKVGLPNAMAAYNIDAAGGSVLGIEAAEHDEGRQTLPKIHLPLHLPFV